MEACAWLSLGDVLRDGDLFDAAADVYGRGSDLAQQAGSIYLARYAADAIGQLRRLRGDLDGDEALARQALHRAREASNRYEAGLYARSLALVHLV